MSAPLTGQPRLDDHAGGVWPGAGRTLLFLWLACFLNQADRQILPVLLPVLRREFGLDLQQLGLLNSSFTWVYALVVPFAGWLGDSFNRKRLLVGALFFWSLATGLSGLSTGFVLLLILRSATGAGEACYFPTATSLLSDVYGPKRMGFAISVHQSANYLGVATAGMIAGWIAESFGWQYSFMLFGVAGIGVAVLLAARLPEPMRRIELPTESARYSVREGLALVLGTRTFYLLTAAFVGMLLVNTAYLAWMPMLLHQNFGLSLAAAGFHAAVYHQGGAILGVLVGGKLSDHWVGRTVLARPLVQLVGLVLGAPFIVLLGLVHERIEVYLALGVFGFFRGMYDSNLFTALFHVTPARVRSLATGLMIGLAFLGGGFAPWLVGIMAKHIGLGHALAWSAVGYVGGAACLAIACLSTFRADVRRAERGGTISSATNSPTYPLPR